MEINSCTGEAPQTAECSGMSRRWKIEFGCCANEILPKRSVVLWANFPFYCIFTEFGAKNAWRMAWGGARKATIGEFRKAKKFFVSISTAQQQSLGPRSLTWWPFPNIKCQARMKNLIKFLCVREFCWCSAEKAELLCGKLFRVARKLIKAHCTVEHWEESSGSPLPFRLKDG